MHDIIDFQAKLTSISTIICQILREPFVPCGDTIVLKFMRLWIKSLWICHTCSIPPLTNMRPQKWQNKLILFLPSEHYTMDDGSSMLIQKLKPSWHGVMELGASHCHPHRRAANATRPGLSKPTGPVKPARSSSGLPDRFDRKPVETGQIQNQIQNRMFNRFRTAYWSVWPV